MSSRFITEAEVEEKKRVRQEEWEKVRKPEEPIEAPVEPVDHRSLFERLQEQKNKKQEEFEETHKLKNLVKVLDDEEVLFLDQVDQDRVDGEKRKRLEEAKELTEFRSAVSQLREKEYEKAIFQEIGLVEKTPKSKTVIDDGIKKTSQSKLLAGIVKRKHSSTSTGQEEVQAKKCKENETSQAEAESKTPDEKEKPKVSTEPATPSVPYKGNFVCIGVLPGLSSYANSDDEECDHDDDSDSDECDSNSHNHCHNVRDLCGRKIEYEVKKDSK